MRSGRPVAREGRPKPMRSKPASPCMALWERPTASCESRSRERARATSTSPARVSVKLRGLRRKSGPPKVSSILRICFVSAGWEMCRIAAARPMKVVRQNNYGPHLAQFHIHNRRLSRHIVALNERHLKRLLAEYVRYHHEARTHLGLEKATPDGRIRSVASGRVLAQERLGGLHHRYDRAA